MTWSISTPVTGAAQTGFTSPTYTLVADTAVDWNSRQHAVSALGGTQTGVVVSSVSCPFTIAFWRPRQFKQLPAANQVTGARSGKVPFNQWGCNVRKGVTPAANMPYSVAVYRGMFDVPAGADQYDAANVRAGLSLFIGALSQQSAGIGDSLVSGVM